jgi:hypothetical protein
MATASSVPTVASYMILPMVYSTLYFLTHSLTYSHIYHDSLLFLPRSSFANSILFVVNVNEGDVSTAETRGSRRKATQICYTFRDTSMI